MFNNQIVATISSMMQTKDIAHQKRAENLVRALDADSQVLSEISDIVVGYFKIISHYPSFSLEYPFRFFKDEWRSQTIRILKEYLAIGIYSISESVFDESYAPCEIMYKDAYYIGFGIAEKAIPFIRFRAKGILPKGYAKGANLEISGPRIEVLVYIDKLEFTGINADFSGLGLKEHTWYAVNYEKEGRDLISILEVINSMQRITFLVSNPLNIYDEHKDIARHFVEQIIQWDDQNRFEGVFIKLSVINGVFRWEGLSDDNEYLSELEYVETKDVFGNK